MADAVAFKDERGAFRIGLTSTKPDAIRCPLAGCTTGPMALPQIFRIPDLHAALRCVFDGVKELARTSGPGVTQCFFPAPIRRERQGGKRRAAQIFVEIASHAVFYDVARPLNREGCNRDAAGKGFDQHEAEGIRAARKNEYVCCRKKLSKIFPRFEPREYRLRVTRAKHFQIRTPAHDVACARQIELKLGFDVLLNCNPADVHEYRPRTFEVFLGARPEKFGIDASRP